MGQVSTSTLQAPGHLSGIFTLMTKTKLFKNVRFLEIQCECVFLCFFTSSSFVGYIFPFIFSISFFLYLHFLNLFMFLAYPYLRSDPWLKRGRSVTFFSPMSFLTSLDQQHMQRTIYKYGSKIVPLGRFLDEKQRILSTFFIISIDWYTFVYTSALSRPETTSFHFVCKTSCVTVKPFSTSKTWLQLF